MPSTQTDRLNGLTTSVALKAPVKAVTSANITLSGLQTVGGVALAADDRVLVKNQTDTTENGIYLASSSDWERAKDFDGNRDAVKGTLVITDGVSTALLFYRLTSADPVVIGTSAITFVQASEVQDPYPITLAEIAATVTPIDYDRRPGDPERYAVNLTPGTTDMATGIQAAVNCAKQGTADHPCSVFLNPTSIYGVGSTIEVDSGKPVNFISDMVTPEGGISGYIKPIATLANGIIRYRHTSRAGVGGVIKGISFYDPTSGGRNYAVEACIVADDFGSGKIIDCSFEYIKGSAIRTDNWTFGDIVRPRIRLCGNTSKPALALGIAGSAYSTQSLTVTDMISEVNYLAQYCHVRNTAYAIKLVGSRYEADTAIADTCQIFEQIDHSDVQTYGSHFYRNTNTQLKHTAGAMVSDCLFSSDNADGKPKIQIQSQGSVLSNLKLIGGATHTGYDIELGSAGNPSYATVDNVVVSGSGIIDYGYGILSNIRIDQAYNQHGVVPTGKYALVLGDAGVPSQASDVSINVVGVNNHGVHLAAAKSRLTNAYIRNVTGTGVGITSVADVDIAAITFSGTTNKFSPANTDPDSTRIDQYSGYEKAGVATITNPATTVVVTHGVEFTPTLKQITVTAGASHTWWISTITSTQFTINVGTTPGSSTDFGWRVKY